jgi:hypothetical protein
MNMLELLAGYPQNVLVYDNKDRELRWSQRSFIVFNKLAEGRNGRGLVVLDVEKAVQFGDLKQVADPFGDVHQL